MPVSKNTFGQIHQQWATTAHENTRSYYIALVLFSIIGGMALLFTNQIIVLFLVLAILGLALIFMYPIFGLVIFVILSFIRPADIMPALGAIPLSKIIGGTALLSLIINRLQTKDFVWGGRLTILLLVFAATLFISIPVSYWPSRSFEVSLDFIKIIIFYFLFINLIRDLKSLRTISLVAISCISILGLSTIYSYLSGSFRAASTIGQGLFGDANDMALILVVAIPLVFYWGISKNKYSYYKLFQPVLLAVLSIGIILTKSRGGLLGFAAVAFLLIMKGRNKIVGIVLFTIMVILAFIIMPSDFSDRYSSIGTYDQDASAMGRLYAWKAGVKMMITRPVTGVGVGCFETAFGLTYRPQGFNHGRWISPHNTLIQVGGETGLIGLAVFLYLYFFAIKLMRNLKPAGSEREKRDVTKIKNMILVSLVGFGVSAFFLTQAFNYMFYFLIASAAGLDDINGRLTQNTEVIELED